MTVAHDLEQHTPTKEIPTQTPAPSVEQLRELDVQRTLLAIEAGTPDISPSQKMVMSVYDQVAINYPGEVNDINSGREAFANRLWLAYALYQEEIIDESTASGRNIAKLSDIWDFVDRLPIEQRPTYTALLELVKDRRIQGSANLKVITMEAACIAAINELDRADPESLAQIIQSE
jgi:hypothetical protein